MLMRGELISMSGTVTKELGLCKFCENRLGCSEHDNIEKTIFFVHCLECGARGPVKDSREEAIAAWNKRAETFEIPNPTFQLGYCVESDSWWSRCLSNGIMSGGSTAIEAIHALVSALALALDFQTSNPSARERELERRLELAIKILFVVESFYGHPKECQFFCCKQLRKSIGELSAPIRGELIK